MLVAHHVDGVHPADAVIHMVAAATLLAIAHPVDKVGLVDERTSHLHKLESAVEHLVDARARHAAADIDERHLQLAAKTQCVLKEIQVWYFTVGIIKRPARRTPHLSHQQSI